MNGKVWSHATRLAWKIDLTKDQRYLLLFFIEKCGARGFFYTHQSIHEHTGLNRKTTGACLTALANLDLIRDSGARKGETNSVVVYVPGPKLLPTSDTANGTTKLSHERDSLGGEAVPSIAASCPANGTGKLYRQRYTESPIEESHSEGGPRGPAPPKTTWSINQEIDQAFAELQNQNLTEDRQHA